MEINKRFKKIISILLYIFFLYVIFLLIKLFIIFQPAHDNFDKYVNNYYNIVKYVLDNNIEEISYNNDKYCINSDCNSLYDNKIIISNLDSIGVSFVENYSNKKLLFIEIDKSVLIKLKTNSRGYARDVAYFYKKGYFFNNNGVNILNNSNGHIRVLDVINNDWALIKID